MSVARTNHTCSVRLTHLLHALKARQLWFHEAPFSLPLAPSPFIPSPWAQYAPSRYALFHKSRGHMRKPNYHDYLPLFRVDESGHGLRQRFRWMVAGCFVLGVCNLILMAILWKKGQVPSPSLLETYTKLCVHSPCFLHGRSLLLYPCTSHF